MEVNNEINMQDEVVKFCVSWVSINVLQSPIANFVQSWNNHRIPGRRGGIPNQLAMSSSVAVSLNSLVIPSTPCAIQLYLNNGGHLTEPHTFGSDPLQNNQLLQQLRFLQSLSINANIISRCTS